MKRILLIATGGTIASKDNGNGLTPSIDVNILLDYIPVIRQMCHVTGISIMNIDSSNMNTAYIASISECIMKNYNNYDGFVITHGTDTCAYTAAALSYQLVNLSKPVILTGSQLPIDAEGTDAVINLTHALIYSCEDISGVFLAFSDKLIKGTCAKKIKAKSFDAFESINYPVIATIQNSTVIYNNYTSKAVRNTGKKFHIETDMCTDIAVISLFPGMDLRIFDYINPSCRGIIIEGYGIGGMPDNITEYIHRLTAGNICVVVTTQCLYEGVCLDIYEVGRNLAKENVINGKSMTLENLTMKLMWSLAHFNNMTDVKDFMEKELY
jgi:L-asparaginase